MENIGAGVSAVLTPKKKEVEEREVEGETTMQKEYNARGEKIYKNAINRENAKIKKKDTASSTKGHSEFH